MKRKLLGSQTFGTTQVRTDEYLLLAKVMVENGQTLEEASIDIQAIDEMLSAQRISAIVQGKRFTATGRLRKDSSLIDIISGRVDQQITELNALKTNQ